ncbi:lipase family protein [Nitrincola sp. MINF-07-Sa-05]|uniref:lipase family protein n=1 Tax=Nitrincola salilacus TaxID=3400273 RepID=UPI0039183176
MPSILDLAKSCEASYSNDPNLAGWIREVRYNPKASGFSGVLFFRETSTGDEAILAFRGTDGLLDHDMVSNINFVRGRMVRQYPDALAALRDASEKVGPQTDLYITGHSLGGGLAALCSVDKWRRGVRNISTVTFNAPGVTRSARYLWGKGSVFYARDRVMNGLDAYYNTHRKALHVQTENDPISHFGIPTIQRLLTVPDLECHAAAQENVRYHYPDFKRSTYFRQSGTMLLRQKTSTALCAHSISNLVKVLERDPIYQEPIEWS